MREACEFLNFRATHSDGEIYGDLDPRFAETSLGRALTEKDDVTLLSVNPTTARTRSVRIKRRNAAQDASRGSSKKSQPSLAAQQEAAATMAEALDAALGPACNAIRDAPPEEPTAAAEAVAAALDVAVASLQSVRGSWLPAAATALRAARALPIINDAPSASYPTDSDPLSFTDGLLTAASAVALPTSIAAEDFHITDREQASRVGTLRRRLLKLAASPLRQLHASAASAPTHRVVALRPPHPPLAVAEGSASEDARLPRLHLPRLHLPEAIHLEWVDSVDALCRLRETLAVADYVGIDTEWADRPAQPQLQPLEVRGAEDAVDSSVAGSREELMRTCHLATVQLAIVGGATAVCAQGVEGEGAAVTDKVYVVDALNPTLCEAYDRALRDLLTWLFGDEATGGAQPPQLVGFAFAGDAQVIAKHLSEGADSNSTTIRRCVIDIQPAAVGFGVGSAGQLPSLRATCEAFLGLTMGKEEQRSDWSQRPLTESQLEYAALDALVCLRVWAVQERLFSSQ